MIWLATNRENTVCDSRIVTSENETTSSKTHNLSRNVLLFFPVFVKLRVVKSFVFFISGEFLEDSHLRLRFSF